MGNVRSGLHGSQTAEPLLHAIDDPRFQHTIMSGYLTTPSDSVLVLRKPLIMGEMQLQRGINGCKRLSSQNCTKSGVRALVHTGTL